MDFNKTVEKLAEMLTPQEQQYLAKNPNKKQELIAKKKNLARIQDADKFDIDMKTGKIIQKTPAEIAAAKTLAQKVR